MWNKGYHRKKSFWSYPDILSIDYYLMDIQDNLSGTNLKENIKIIKKCKVTSTTHPITLTFGNYSLEIQGIDEAAATIRGLEYALENYKLNTK